LALRSSRKLWPYALSSDPYASRAIVQNGIYVADIRSYEGDVYASALPRVTCVGARLR
jgi:hypothetical protein